MDDLRLRSRLVDIYGVFEGTAGTQARRLCRASLFLLGITMPSKILEERFSNTSQ